MHPFFIFGALLHATACAVVGFFVLFAATRSAGLLRTVGNILGAWLFILAVVALVGGFLAHGMGRRHAWGMQPAANAVSAPAAPASQE
jgi:Ca2+/Na+ antiporter